MDGVIVCSRQYSWGNTSLSWFFWFSAVEVHQLAAVSVRPRGCHHDHHDCSYICHPYEWDSVFVAQKLADAWRRFPSQVAVGECALLSWGLCNQTLYNALLHVTVHLLSDCMHVSQVMYVCSSTLHNNNCKAAAFV